MKGIILTGGRGSRLYPLTLPVSKPLLPIYDKPLVYYPLSVLMLAGIKEILLISNQEYLPDYQKLLGDGSHIGISIEYAVQEIPKGSADAFLLGEKFLRNGKKEGCCLIFGDNIFYGPYFTKLLDEAKAKVLKGNAAVVFGYPVTNPGEFGVVTFDSAGKVTSIEEKPKEPKSNYAVPGLYFYDSDAVEIAKNVKPSVRGEIEITSVNDYYLRKGRLHVTLMERGMVWLDTGTADRMLKASTFVQGSQEMQGYYVSCIEEIAWRKGFIDTEQLLRLGHELSKTNYGKYIIDLANEKA